MRNDYRRLGEITVTRLLIFWTSRQMSYVGQSRSWSPGTGLGKKNPRLPGELNRLWETVISRETGISGQTTISRPNQKFIQYFRTFPLKQEFSVFLRLSDLTELPYFTNTEFAQLYIPVSRDFLSSCFKYRHPSLGIIGINFPRISKRISSEVVVSSIPVFSRFTGLPTNFHDLSRFPVPEILNLGSQSI